MAGTVTTGGGQRPGDAGPPGPGSAATHRPAARRHRRLLPAVVAATVLVLAGTWVLHHTSLLDVRTVAVAGTGVLTEQQVRRAAAVPLGEPLAAVDTAEVESRLRRALPRIARVEAERSWPHTLHLSVTERRPVAVLRDGSGYTEVDREGVGYAEVDRPPSGVPLVRLRTGGGAGQRQFGTRRLLRSAVRVAADLPEAVRKQARLIEVRSFDGIRLRLTGGREVVWGSAERGAAKGKALLAVMRAVKDAERYDVSAPSAPAAAQ